MRRPERARPRAIGTADDTVLVWPLRVGEMGVGDPKRWGDGGWGPKNQGRGAIKILLRRISFISDLLWESAQDISYISRCGLTITISSVLQAAGT